MKFAIDSMSKCCSARLGSLSTTNVCANSKVSLSTPGLVLHTKGGSVPYLSKEVLNYVATEQQMMQYSLSNTEHMEEAVRVCGEGISNFVGQKESVSMLVLKDPAELCKPHFHEKDFVPIFSRSGRKNFTSERYMQLVEAFKPDIYVPLFDGDTDCESSKKRLQKSVDRTEKFVEQCIQMHRKKHGLKQSTLIGPVVGGFNLKLRSQSLEFLEQFKDDFSGFLIAGLHSNGISATELEETSLLEVVRHDCSQLPSSKPRFMMGAFSPKTILKLVTMGVDVFDTSYSYIKTQQNRALVFSYDTTEKNVDNQETELDLTDPKWTEDFTGFSKTCTCLACTKHTKAYTHHLYNTREMLGPILLMIHNLHHYREFFKAIRKHVEDDTINELIDHLTKQREHHAIDHVPEKDYLDQMSSHESVVKKLKV